MSGQPWYRHNPRDFLDGIVGMTPDLIGAYIVTLDLIYARGGPIPNEPRWLGGVMGCSSRAATSLVDRLIAGGKLSLVDGKLSNVRAENELAAEYARDAIPTAIRREVVKRDGSVCTYCGETDGPFELDHIHPYSRGGSDTVENLTVACRPCNRSKGARTVGEWLN